MSTVMIVFVLLVVAVAAAGMLLGRTSYEVESARDTEYVELEGHWVRYNVIGGGPPVLLVHGWLSSSRIWEQLARRLAQRFTVYTLDLTGFGESDKPTEGYGTRNGSRLLYAFCAHFGLSRTTVIGHDFSGSMAVKLAADHPDIVGRLVLVATPADEEQIDLPTLLWLTTLPVVGPLFYSLGRVVRPLRKFWMRAFVFDPTDLPAELVEDAGRSTPAAASATYSLTWHEIAGGRVARQARIIKVPIMLISGEDDQIIDPRAVSDWGQYAEQAEIVLLDKCGHLPMVEAPAEFSARVLAFLTGDSRYLEYVKEVPPVLSQDPVEQPEEEERPHQREEPEEEPKEEARREWSTHFEQEDPSDERKPDIGDLNWNFSTKKPSTPRRDRISTPRPEEPGPQEPDTEEIDPSPEPRSPDAPSVRRATPLSRNKDSADAERGSRDPDGARTSGERTASGAGRIPEFPGDLFQWGKAPEEDSRRRRRRRRSGRGGDEDEG